MAMSSGPIVVLTRAQEDNEALSRALQARGVPVLEVPCISTRYLTPKALPESCRAVVFSSRRGVRGLFQNAAAKDWLIGEERPLVAAVGSATAAELNHFGLHADLIADPPRGDVLAGLIGEQIQDRGRVAVVRGNLRAGGLDEILRQAGFEIVPVQVYENLGPPIPGLVAVPVAAVFIASPSAARRLLAHNPWLKSAPFYAIGTTTRGKLLEMGVSRVHAAGGSFDAWVEALCRAHSHAVQGP